MFSVLFHVICIYRVFRPFTTKVSLQKILCENLHILFIFAFFLELQAHVHIRTCSSLIVVGQQQMIAALCGNCQEFVVGPRLWPDIWPTWPQGSTCWHFPDFLLVNTLHPCFLLVETIVHDDPTQGYRRPTALLYVRRYREPSRLGEKTNRNMIEENRKFLVIGPSGIIILL